MLWGSAGQPAARALTDATKLTSEGERRWSEHHLLYRTTVGHIWICRFRSGSRMKPLRVGLHCPLVARIGANCRSSCRSPERSHAYCSHHRIDSREVSLQAAGLPSRADSRAALDSPGGGDPLATDFEGRPLAGGPDPAMADILGVIAPLGTLRGVEAARPRSQAELWELVCEPLQVDAALSWLMMSPISVSSNAQCPCRRTDLGELRWQAAAGPVPSA